MNFTFSHPYAPAREYERPVAYFCMEFAIHQCLKLYSGGLGYLAGSHLRSAFELRQNLVGVGILWKYGYYDQVRKEDQGMGVLFQEKVYGFLEPTNIKFPLEINQRTVWVTAYYLNPEIFKTAPLFLLSTDLPENDYLGRSACFRLYDSNPENRIAADILLGAGGCRLFDYLDWKPDIWHFNESHALPLAFALYQKLGNWDAVRSQLVFTNHTPEQSGNQRTDYYQLERMGFFQGIAVTDIERLDIVSDGMLNHTLAALRLAGLANAVSALHRETLERMWKDSESICPIIHITNAQDAKFWADHEMYRLLAENSNGALMERKKANKRILFEEVADQNGELYDANILTIVFAKRFAGYKRAELLLADPERFERLVNNKERPVQIIWAGKPYPMDYQNIAIFDRIVQLYKQYYNCSILVGYELKLSKLLKAGADVWLNVPRLTHEASGTSGMSAAMNGAINLSIPDGWYPEFVKDGENGFTVPPADPSLPDHQLDEMDAASLYDQLENRVIPMYYDKPEQWLGVIKRSLTDIIPYFDSKRMADEYYRKLYALQSPVAGKNFPNNVE